MNDRSTLNQAQLYRLLEVGRELAGELHLERMLGRALDVARDLTGARYAAVGVLDEQREELESLRLPSIDGDAAFAVGSPPTGEGVLSVPLVVRGKLWGFLNLADKPDGQFGDADCEMVEALAGWVGTAIGNAQLYHGIEYQRDDLQRANRALEAATEIARAVGGETELEPILATIVERGRLLVEADSLAVLLATKGDSQLRLVASSVPSPTPVVLPVSGSAVGQAFRYRRPMRVEHLDTERFTAEGDSGPGAMLVPLLFRGECLGVLVAVERARERPLLPGRDEEPVLLSIAASAATAVGTARSVAESRVRHSLQGAERERARWARELHDDTLQNLAGLRMMISGARRAAADERIDEMLGESLGRVDGIIADLRRLIADLRPAALDELGIAPALSALVERVSADTGLNIDLELDLGAMSPHERLPLELEITIYRLIQEALANVVAHAEAESVQVELAVDEEIVGVRVADDGRGFDPSGFWRRWARGLVRADHGFGLPGMRERVALVRGWLDIDSVPGRGAILTATIPRDQGW